MTSTLSTLSNIIYDLDKISEYYIPNEIFYYILITAGFVTGINRSTNLIIHNRIRLQIKNWLERIRVKTKWEDIDPNNTTDLYQRERNWKYLIKLYQHRKKDLPIEELTYFYSNSGFDRTIFYSKCHTIKSIDLLDINYEMIRDILVSQKKRFGTKELETLNTMVKQTDIYPKLRVGDIIWFDLDTDLYIHQEIWNGQSFQRFDFKTTKYITGTIPKNFHIQDYPTADYFGLIRPNKLVWLRTNKDNLKLVRDFGNDILKYRTIDKYIIYSIQSEFKQKYETQNEVLLEYLIDVTKVKIQDQLMQSNLLAAEVDEIWKVLSTDIDEQLEETPGSILTSILM